VTVRVRMAPSPTGYLHIGNARTFLYNWLFATQHGGTCLLRIEDTDQVRHLEDAIQVIRDGLTWLGLGWDEEHRQSARAHLYLDAADELAAAGRTYWCDCTRDAVDDRAKERGGPPGYDGYCRERGLVPGQGRAQRFRTPDEGVTVVPDVVRGDPEFRNATIEDFVIRRSDGSAVFILANVVDDGDMRITHVIRGEDHLPNTPKYLLLWDALGHGEHPVFAHLPMMVNEKRQKLSKRRDPVAVSQYRDEGYLPEVFANYLALVGWAPKDGREQMTIAEMVEAFRLEDVNNSPGFFDVQKLRAFNGDAIRALDLDDFVARASAFLPDGVDLGPFVAVAPLVQERVAILSEVWEQVAFLYAEEPAIDEQAWAKGMKGGAAEVLDGALELYADVDWKADELNRVLFEWANERGLKAQAPVRLAVTGRSKGLPLWESLEVLGRERTLERIRAARARL
jgi:glutamyl-tRNA synthetase